jgi:hypothetical protein
MRENYPPALSHSQRFFMRATLSYFSDQDFAPLFRGFRTFASPAKKGGRRVPDRTRRPVARSVVLAAGRPSGAGCAQVRATNRAHTPHQVREGRRAPSVRPTRGGQRSTARHPPRTCRRETCAPAPASFKFSEAAAPHLSNRGGLALRHSSHPPCASVPTGRARGNNRPSSKLTIPFPSSAPGGARPSQESNPHRRASAGTN